MGKGSATTVKSHLCRSAPTCTVIGGWFYTTDYGPRLTIDISKVSSANTQGIICATIFFMISRSLIHSLFITVFPDTVVDVLLIW